MKKNNIFSTLLIVGVIALFAYLVWANPESEIGIDVAAPTNLTNASGNLLLNATTNATADNLTFIFNYFSNDSHFYNTTIGPDDALNTTFNVTIDTSSVLEDGLFALIVNGTEFTNATIANTTIAVLVDNVAPDVQVLTVGFADRRNFTTGDSLTFNVTVANGTTATGVNVTDIQVVKFNITNNTGSDKVWFNVTANNENNTAFNYSQPVSGLVDGNHTMVVYANDTAGNLNNSQNITFIVDTTQPDAVDLYNLTEGVNVTDTTPTFIWQVNDSLSEVLTCDWILNDIINQSFTNVSNGTSYYFTPTVALASGAHNWSVSCNDSVLLNNISATATNFTIVTTAPSVFIVNRTFDTTNTTPFITFNFTDNTFATATCSLINETDGVSFNTTTGVSNDTNTNLTVNVTLEEGTYELGVNCTESLGSVIIGEAGHINVTVDLSAPTTDASSASVTSSSATLSVTTNEPATCKYGGSDVAYASMTNTMTGTGTSHSASINSLTAGTSYTRYVRCKDNLENTQTSSKKITFTTSSVGTGGSGGGSSSGTKGVFEKKTWTSINAGETATMAVNNGVMGITEISFSVSAKTYGAWVSVQKQDSLPSDKSFSKKTYKITEINENNVKKVLKGAATVKFKVLKTWLAANKLDKGDVAYHRYADGKWTELSTTVGKDDGTYVHYSAQTPGFSYFVIGEKAKAVAKPAAKAPAAKKEAAKPAAKAPAAKKEAAKPAAKAPAAKAPAKKSSGKGWIVTLVVALVVVGLVLYFWKKKK